jgi:hypothetical protein
MAPSGSGSPGPLPRPLIQDHLCQHASVWDQLCNHKQAVTMWSTDINVECCCKNWPQYKKASLNPSDPHWGLSGPLFTGLLPQELAAIAEGSLLNKVFPTKKVYQATLTQGLRAWTNRSGLPSMIHAPQPYFRPCSAHLLWQQHTNHLTHHITKSTINAL